MVGKKNKQWDPTWGWDNEIYHLGTFSDKKNTPLFNSQVHLLKGNKIVLSSNKERRVCAGSFNEQFYFGSLSYVTHKNKIYYLDQSVVVYNKEFELLVEFRPSEKIKKPSNNFTCLKDPNNKFIVPFRDPAIMFNGNLAVCTGGWRWETKANICEISYKNNELKILRESIIDETLKSFSEIERCTFWNEYMFFSVGGAMGPNQFNTTEIIVAKLNKNGLYSYYGVVENSSGVYGGCLNEKLQLLYWYPSEKRINNPLKQNLFFENRKWILKEEDKVKHFFYRNVLIKKNKKEIYDFLSKFFSKFKIIIKKLFNRILKNLF